MYSEDVLTTARRDLSGHKPSIHSRTRRCPDCGDTLYTDLVGQWHHFDSGQHDCDDLSQRWTTPA